MSLLARVPVALVVNPSTVAAKDLAGFLAAARKSPGVLNVGSSGLGTIPHLAIELLQQRAGIKLNHVPYRGGGQALQDVVSGQIDAMFTPLSTVVSYVQSGRLRALAVASRLRQPILPDLPTFSEAGLADFRVSTWYGLFAPKATPVANVDTCMPRSGGAGVGRRQARLGGAGRARGSREPSGLRRLREGRGRALERHRQDHRHPDGLGST